MSYQNPANQPSPVSWANSTRRQRLPKNWHFLREQVKKRAGLQCEAYLNNGLRCVELGTDCDHIVAGDNHDLENLQWLCTWHHKKKTSLEGNNAKKKPITESRPKERHPGLL